MCLLCKNIQQNFMILDTERLGEILLSNFWTPCILQERRLYLHTDLHLHEG